MAGICLTVKFSVSCPCPQLLQHSHLQLPCVLYDPPTQGHLLQAVAKGPGQMLSTVTLVASAARQLQDHYGALVAPALEGAPAADAAAEAAAGLTTALQFMQQESLECLSTSINAFFIQVAPLWSVLRSFAAA